MTNVGNQIPRVFILGAGFSAAAGVPLTGELLQATLLKFSAESPGIYRRLEAYALEALSQGDGPLDVSIKGSFSKLCTYLEFIELREFDGQERWSINGCREKLTLRYYLAKTLVERTPSSENLPELYTAFARLLRPCDTVISFNWDGLLEASLAAVGKAYSYGRGDNKSSIRINKLHGSVNWRLGEPQGNNEQSPRLNWQKLDFGKFYATDDLLNWNTWASFGPLIEVEPFLVLPGYGKAFDVRANARNWDRPEFAFALAKNAYVIGLSITEDDFLVRSLFLYTLPRILETVDSCGCRVTVINSCTEIRSNYDFELRGGFLTFWNETFRIEHVRRIAEDSS